MELPQLGAGAGARQQAGRRVRPRHHHRRGQHVHRGPGELLPDRPRRRRLGRDDRRSCSSASASAARSATITRSRSGARTTTTAWPRSSSGSAPRTARSSASSAARRSSIMQADRRGDAPAQGRRGQAACRSTATRASWDDEFDRRKKLADWLTAPTNTFFARNIANRFWGYTMGRGLVEPLDDMRATNPASNPELLDALADDFVEDKFDLKHLLRTIFNCAGVPARAPTRRRATRPTRRTSTSRATRVRRLTAEQLADALDFATGTREKYPGLPLGTRAIQLPDTRGEVVPAGHVRPAGAADHLRVRADDAAEHRPGAAPAQRRLPQQEDRATRRAASRSCWRPRRRCRRRSRSCTWPPGRACRAPTKQKKAEGWVKSAPTVKEGLQDLLWVLANSREFLFNR